MTSDEKIVIIRNWVYVFGLYKDTDADNETTRGWMYFAKAELWATHSAKWDDEEDAISDSYEIVRENIWKMVSSI